MDVGGLWWLHWMVQLWGAPPPHWLVPVAASLAFVRAGQEAEVPSGGQSHSLGTHLQSPETSPYWAGSVILTCVWLWFGCQDSAECLYSRSPFREVSRSSLCSRPGLLYQQRKAAVHGFSSLLALWDRGNNCDPVPVPGERAWNTSIQSSSGNWKLLAQLHSASYPGAVILGGVRGRDTHSPSGRLAHLVLLSLSGCQEATSLDIVSWQPPGGQSETLPPLGKAAHTHRLWRWFQRKDCAAHQLNPSTSPGPGRGPGYFWDTGVTGTLQSHPAAASWTSQNMGLQACLAMCANAILLLSENSGTEKNLIILHG